MAASLQPLTRHRRDAELPIGSIFQGGYEIVVELGAGTSGIVYRARQLSTGQDVAIKVLQLRGGSTPSHSINAVERFRREMRLCVELYHPNVVPLIDSGESDDGLLYAVFQYVPGATLKDVLAAEGKLSIAETIHLMTQVLDALSCAHVRGIVHRDLKPENIMLTKTGVRRNALVLDFGLGGFAQEVRERALPRITATQEMMGTPCYAAPEQLRGEPPSSRSDLYSWGLIFLECLTGELAVSGGSTQDVILKQLGPDPVPIPSWLADRHLRRVLETVTAKSVEKRDVTIEGLLQALGVLTPLATSPQRAAPDTLDGERRQLTIVSGGLTVTCAPGEGVDLEELDELLHAQHAVLAEIAARQGGQIAGVLADRILLVFGYPQAHENDARRAARTALQIAAEIARRAARLKDERGVQITVRLGVHTGVVIARELRQGLQQGVNELIGITPQIAARLEALAAPGEVLVSAETCRLLRGDLAVAPAGEHAMSGLPDHMPVYRLVDGAPAAAARDTLSYAQQTPAVGRDRELAQLTACWQQTLAGRGSAVLITGEPGIGKSRMVRELRRRVPRDAWLECRCMPEIADSSLRPLADLVLGMEESLDTLLTRYGFDLPDTLPLFAAFCALPPDPRFPPLPHSPDRQKELTLNALVTLFARVAAERPIVLTIEDLHWADPTTIELITQLVQELRSAAVADDDPAGRITLLLTARPEFGPPWPGEDVATMQLARLEAQDVEAMVRHGLGRNDPIPAAALVQIVRRADGIPLFVEEVTRVLNESGRLALGDDAADHAPVEIPSTLRDLLMARLDALSFGARETAQLAAVLGREFRYEELRAVARKDEQVLREDLRELTDAGLGYHRRSARAEAYVFKHALVRDVAYETMLRSTRQNLHNRVANTLRQRFPDIERQRPELIALHYERGDQPELAAAYWKRAGDRTMARGAYVESMRHFERGLALLRRLPESAERLQQELGLIESLGTALLATRGYTAPEVVDAFGRAAALSERLGSDVPIRVLNGIWGVHFMRGDRDATARMIPTMERLAQTSTDPVSLMMAHGAIGVRAFFTGEFARANAEMERATTWYRTKGYEHFLGEYGYDGGIYVFGYWMWSAMILGQADRASTARDEMMALAEHSRNPYGLAIAMQFSMNFERDLGNAAAVLAIAERTVPLLTEQKLYMWLGWAAAMQGWALAVLGDAEAGIGQLEFGLQLVDTIGVRTSYGYFLAGLAEAHRARGAAAEGLAVVQRAFAASEETLDSFYVAELRRLQGALHLLQGDRGEAEGCFRSALDLARAQEARTFALRAATSLARLLFENGDQIAARAALAEPCEWFRNALPTPHVLEARALLAELVPLRR